jgi:cytochrome c oxidase cbb3-type subunit I/II
MPSYSLMAERDVLAVIQYLKTYSEAWIDPERHTNPISIPTVPAWFRDVKEVEIRSAKGKVVYDQLCLSCHGESGDGRGPSAETLTDSWDHPVQPADLRKPYVRSGRTLGDLYRVLVTGVGGSPMPSYLESTTEEQRWEIVAYIHTLRLQHKKARKGFQ